MGFFSPGNSKNRYMGIWYKETLPVMTVVWVANRKTPLTDMSGKLKLVSNPGILVLANGSGNIIWSTNTSRPAQGPVLVAQLLDSGNLVVRDTLTDDGNFLWQSFDYPSDTLLPGMKLGKDFETGLERYLSTWKSNDDPSPGDFTYHCEPRGYPQNVMRKGSVEQYRTGSWNGVRFSGVPNLSPNSIFRYRLVFNDKEVYYSYDLINSSVISRLMLSQNGVLQRWTWPVGRSQGWVLYLTTPTDNCDTYSLCGAYGTCNIGVSPLCRCLNKFAPKDSDAWANTDWSNGCVRKTPLDCNNNRSDGFLMYSHVKLPDTQNSWFNVSMTLEECRKACSNNCSCMAYANLDIRGGGSGCLLWFADLIDIRDFPDGAGQDVYVRMASSDSEMAVKRLSKTSRQGPVEFKNEVICIAKLQHRNLVKLLGCCIQGKEKMLIYEYMPNKSLDSFIFVIYCISKKETNLFADETRSMLLDWPKRFHIINGIARGLVYLHQDSRLRIIHRDLKASNILLDSNMDPKISDFGLARSFAENETGANTNRVVGTYGYMSPEYAVDGLFSVKSDVFSFGVMVLEIVCGKRNRGFFHPDHHHNLLGHVSVVVYK
ncbi:hypothetical protein RJ640_001303 [Escallonia rubra]|uniref:Non-specific serine/threonine protein kinase n=1 Tax=Escallonia rubra TaxID=112253 RepID=A0AA88U2B9_9ASTE|nr:hypothetical protein RJ640_001303 [Escallonia rubra]